MNYSKEEVNEILLSKKLNDFYLAIIENRQELLTDEEYEQITRSDKTLYGGNEDKIEELIEKVNSEEHLKKYVPDIMKVIYSFAQIRHVAILTMIGDETYDIANASFVDLKRNKVVHYDNLTNYYDETNARVRYFTPEEEPQLKETTVLLDVDDESIVFKYENDHVRQEASDDLTGNFIKEAKEIKHSLAMKPNNM